MKCKTKTSFCMLMKNTKVQDLMTPNNDKTPSVDTDFVPPNKRVKVPGPLKSVKKRTATKNSNTHTSWPKSIPTPKTPNNTVLPQTL